jgi:single-strand DNA-binding protein
MELTERYRAAASAGSPQLPAVPRCGVEWCAARARIPASGGPFTSIGRPFTTHDQTRNENTVANFNKVILLGNLTRDVELRHTQSGMALGKFGMAINRKWSQNGEQKESTCFVDLTAWGRQAELLNQYVKTGSQLFVEGRLEYSTWEAEGGKRSKLEVIVENFQFVGSARGGEGGGGGERRSTGGAGKRQQAAGAEGGGGEVDYGDIPF